MKHKLVIAIAFLTGVAVARAAPTALMGSAAVTWEEIQGGPGKGMGKSVFRSPTATLDELEMHVTTLPPGKAPHAPHTHVEEELVIIKEGTLEAMQNGKVKKVGPGGVLFQASNQLHGVKNVGEGQAAYYVIRWKSPSGKTTAAPAPAGKTAAAPAPAAPATAAKP